MHACLMSMRETARGDHVDDHTAQRTARGARRAVVRPQCASVWCVSPLQLEVTSSTNYRLLQRRVNPARSGRDRTFVPRPADIYPLVMFAAH